MSTREISADSSTSAAGRPRNPSRLSGGVRQHLAALRALLALTVILGLAYPLAVTGIAQVLFAHQANGSLVKHGGVVVGSSLLGQAFVDAKGNPDPRWFQPRPSAASDPADKNDPGYNPLFSGASNLGPTNPKLIKGIDDLRKSVAAFDGVSASQVPADALTASGSGLDPDISPAYADEQVNRVAKARGLSVDAVRALVASHVRGRPLGVLGAPRVNVLALNSALASLGGAR